MKLEIQNFTIFLDHQSHHTPFVGIIVAVLTISNRNGFPISEFVNRNPLTISLYIFTNNSNHNFTQTYSAMEKSPPMQYKAMTSNLSGGSSFRSGFRFSKQTNLLFFTRRFRVAYNHHVFIIQTSSCSQV